MDSEQVSSEIEQDEVEFEALKEKEDLWLWCNEL